MESVSNNKKESVLVSPLSVELSKNSNESSSEEVVIYDECGDTLWDRVLAQEDKTNNPAQRKNLAEIKIDKFY